MKFPVLQSYRFWLEFPDCPRWVDWTILEPNEKQAVVNHSQSLEKLASRGGLSPHEIYAIMHEMKVAQITDQEAVDYLCSLTNMERS
jgi:hypothetical protein